MITSQICQKEELRPLTPVAIINYFSTVYWDEKWKVLQNDKEINKLFCIMHNAGNYFPKISNDN